MPIRIDQWWVSIGLLCNHVYELVSKNKQSCLWNGKIVDTILFFFVLFISLMLKNGNVEINPGPKKINQFFFLL